MTIEAFHPHLLKKASIPVSITLLGRFPSCVAIHWHLLAKDHPSRGARGFLDLDLLCYFIKTEISIKKSYSIDLSVRCIRAGTG